MQPCSWWTRLKPARRVLDSDAAEIGGRVTAFLTRPVCDTNTYMAEALVTIGAFFAMLAFCAWVEQVALPRWQAWRARRRFRVARRANPDWLSEGNASPKDAA